MAPQSIIPTKDAGEARQHVPRQVILVCRRRLRLRAALAITVREDAASCHVIENSTSWQPGAPRASESQSVGNLVTGPGGSCGFMEHDHSLEHNISSMQVD